MYCVKCVYGGNFCFRERFLDLVEGRLDTGGMTKMKDVSLKGVKGVSGERVVNKIQDFVWDDILSEHCQFQQVRMLHLVCDYV